ncbi:MAG: Bax inhibitor-1/YccA family protein [Rhodothalassiaceae bacterium]
MVERYQGRTAARTVERGIVMDEGLRAFMLNVYNYMTGGVLLTGIMAMLVYRVPALQELFYQTAVTPSGMTMVAGMTGLGWIVTIAPLAFVLVMSFGINRLSAGAAQALFWAFAAVMGLSLSSIFFVYTGASIARTFFVAAAAFGALSLYGYTTKRSLSGFGTFLFMGLIGLLIAMIVNIFLKSTMMDLVISAVGVLIFAGLTAYDTQRLKALYFDVAGQGEAAAKVAIMGALNLYLDFINLFLFLLRFMGNSRN